MDIEDAYRYKAELEEAKYKIEKLNEELSELNCYVINLKCGMQRFEDNALQVKRQCKKFLEYVRDNIDEVDWNMIDNFPDWSYRADGVDEKIIG